MHTQQVFKLGIAVLFALTLAACASSDTEDMAETEDSTETVTTAPNNQTTTVTTTGTGNNNGLTAREMQEQQAALNTTVFYFEFDRSDLSAEARAALVHHANYLKANSSERYRLEGHADERGTREYNLALAERRAQAVERYLQVQGVSSGQLETISYGEENPVDPGTTEAAYARNRRVEIH